MAQPTISLDPTLPQGSESLKIGDDRIRNVALALLNFFGFTAQPNPGVLAPFSFLNAADQAAGLASVNGDPDNDLGIVPRQYADRRTLFCALTGGPAYTANPVPGLPASNLVPPANSVYVLLNGGAASSGPSTLTLSGGLPYPLRRADGTELAAGDLASAQIVLAAFNAAVPEFRIVGFIGGTVTSPIILPADPSVALAAATKQYVDATADLPARTILTAPVALTNAGVTVITVPTITIPADGPRVIRCEYAFALQFGGAIHDGAQSGGYVTDGATAWAVSSSLLTPTSIAGGNIFIIAGAGASPISYAAGSTVDLKLTGFTAETGANAIVALPLPTPQASYITVQTVRTH